MAQTSANSHPSWLLHFNSIDSTNNYAMKLVDDGMAQHGQVVWADLQTNGKGQRGKSWDSASSNLLMSLIVMPKIAIDKQFALSMLVAGIIAKYLQTMNSKWQIAIKWPNDIYINDKKTCGILIENVFRGMHWSHAIIGIGLNVNQENFPENIPNATSIKNHLGKTSDLLELLTDLRSGILNALQQYRDADYTVLLKSYNSLLYKKRQEHYFKDVLTEREFSAFIQEVNEAGQLVLLSARGIEVFSFGQIVWLMK